MAGRVLQVAYDLGLLRIRELALVQYGFSVTSVHGNAEARRKLDHDAPFDAVLIGWSTTHEDRKAIVRSLKQHWPAIPVVAIHDSFQSAVPGADVTATHDAPEEWLAALDAETNRQIGEAGTSA